MLDHAKIVPAALVASCVMCWTMPASAQIVADRIDDGIVRFYASRESADNRRPSFAFREAFESKGAVRPAARRVRPEFSVDESTGRFVATIATEAGTSLYGTGQAAGALLRNGQVTETWNFDAFGYGLGDPSLYTSRPWVLAVRADGSAFGVLADTSERTEIDLRGGITFRGV